MKLFEKVNLSFYRDEWDSNPRAFDDFSFSMLLQINSKIILKRNLSKKKKIALTKREVGSCS